MTLPEPAAQQSDEDLWEAIVEGRMDAADLIARQRKVIEARTAALAELVACKDLKDELDALREPAPVDMNYDDRLQRSQRAREVWTEYEDRKPLAWEAARAALRMEAPT